MIVVAAKIRAQMVQRWRPMNWLMDVGETVEGDVTGSGIAQGFWGEYVPASALLVSATEQNFDLGSVFKIVAPEKFRTG